MLLRGSVNIKPRKHKKGLESLEKKNESRVGGIGKDQIFMGNFYLVHFIQPLVLGANKIKSKENRLLFFNLLSF